MIGPDPHHAGLLSAAELDACAELLAPLALVGLAPLQLAGLEGRAAHDDLEALVLVGGAGDALEVALGHYAAATEPLAVLRRLGDAEESEEDGHSGPHRAEGRAAYRGRDQRLCQVCL